MKKHLTDLAEQRAKEDAMDTGDQSDTEEESDCDEEEKELSGKLANLKEEEKKELKK